MLRKLALDLAGLCGVSILILAVLACTVRADWGDVRVSVAITLFLLPGWLLSPHWISPSAGTAARYVHASIGSFAIHSWLAGIGSLLNLSFDFYYVGFAICAGSALWDRIRTLRVHGRARQRRLDLLQAAIWIGVIALVSVLYRAPLSNDIGQFLLQQIDMTHERSLSPSAIGMQAWGITEPMPRWNANLWHVWFSLLADVTRLSVEGLLVRWASVPVAMIALATLLHCVREYAGRQTPWWAVALAVFAPVLIWFRDYNAFVYGFRLTNNLCLDKDFALFWLIPAWLLIVRIALARTGRAASWFVLLGLCPAVIRFHPLTSIYLLLLLPILIVMLFRRSNALRTGAIAGLTLVLALVMFWLGDAQSYHRELERLVRVDFSESATGRPLHYWVGHYATMQKTIREAGLKLDTTHWIGNKLHLRAAVILNCSLLLSGHVAWLVWGCRWINARRQRWTHADRRVWFGVGLALLMLWTIWLASGILLARFPHLYRGYERLHWFAYVPLLVALSRFFQVASAFAANLGFRSRRALVRRRYVDVFATSLLLVLFGYFAIPYANGEQSYLNELRGLHSLLDMDAGQRAVRLNNQQRLTKTSAGPIPTRPEYLKYLMPRDRVLFLHGPTDDMYWCLRQAVYWNELYGEAFALHVLGDKFLEERNNYYAIFDRQPTNDAAAWLKQRGVTLIVDSRAGADEYFANVGKLWGVDVEQIGEGVWRVRK